MSFVRTFARPLFASSFIAAGVERIRQADDTAQQLGGVLRPVANAVPQLNDKLLARTLGGVQLGAGALLALGKMPRLAGFLLAITSTLNSAAEFSAANTTTPEGRQWQRTQLLKNISLTGGVLLASVDTAGKPSLAWRAEHLAETGREQVKHASKAVRKNARKTAGALSNAVQS